MAGQCRVSDALPEAAFRVTLRFCSSNVALWPRFRANVQTKLAGLTSTLTGGIAVSRGTTQDDTVSYRQLPTLPTPTDMKLTVTRKSANELRFTMEDVQMPVYLDATCVPFHASMTAIHADPSFQRAMSAKLVTCRSVPTACCR